MKSMYFLCKQYADATNFLEQKYGILSCRSYFDYEKMAFQMNHASFLAHFPKYAVKLFTGSNTYNYELFADAEGMQFFTLVSENDVKEHGLTLDGLLPEELPEVLAVGEDADNYIGEDK